MKHLAAMLLLLGSGHVACADLGPPPGKKGVSVTTIVESTEDFADYAFFAVSYWEARDPKRTTEMSCAFHFFVPGTIIQATGGRREGGTLYAVPRVVVEKNKIWSFYAARFATEDPLVHSSFSDSSDESWAELGRKVGRGEVPGSISVRFGGYGHLAIRDERTEITETYRIVRTPSGIAFVNAKYTAPETTDPRDTSGNGPESATPWRWIAAGGAGSLALVLGGVWLARRLSPRRHDPERASVPDEGGVDARRSNRSLL